MLMGLCVASNVQANSLLGGLASKLTETATNQPSQPIDINSYIAKAKATNLMFTQSRTALATLFAERQDAEEIKIKRDLLNKTSDLKEKDAIQKDITKLTNSVLTANQKDEAAMVEKIQNFDARKKQLLVESMTNFVIAGLSARELVTSSKQVSTQLLTNPMSLSNSGLSLVDAKGLIGDVSGIAKNSTMALVQYPQLLKKAGVSFKVPDSATTKPVELSDF